MLRAILFDLDGTLLPMNMEEFTKGYFSLLAKKAAGAGYEGERLIGTIWRGTGDMVKNDGSVTNETRFWQAFAAVYGKDALADKALFDDFYQNEFHAAVRFTQPRPELAAACLAAARRAAGQVVLATNPLFPAAGVEARLSWIGLQTADFDYVTTYENACFCKPNPEYYRSLLRVIGTAPGDALMIGNDVREDVLASGSIGLCSYLVRDCLIGEPPADCLSGMLADLPLWLESIGKAGTDAPDGRAGKTESPLRQT